VIVLDTDCLSILDAGQGKEFELLNDAIARSEQPEVYVTVVSFEEQMRGWLSYIAASRAMKRQVDGYTRLHAILRAYLQRLVLDFDLRAMEQFEALRRQIRIGAMDLKIASICLVHDALLVSRNLRDFRKVPGLKVQDWTAAL
jgi:tRNA(fMet)-specific endonuclease VapC